MKYINLFTSLMRRKTKQRNPLEELLGKHVAILGREEKEYRFGKLTGYDRNFLSFQDVVYSDSIDLHSDFISQLLLQNIQTIKMIFEKPWIDDENVWKGYIADLKVIDSTSQYPMRYDSFHYIDGGSAWNYFGDQRGYGSDRVYFVAFFDGKESRKFIDLNYTEWETIRSYAQEIITKDKVLLPRKLVECQESEEGIIDNISNITPDPSLNSGNFESIIQHILSKERKRRCQEIDRFVGRFFSKNEDRNFPKFQYISERGYMFLIKNGTNIDQIPRYNKHQVCNVATVHEITPIQLNFS